MPLVTGELEAERYEGGVEFHMENGDDFVRVRVTDDALKDKESLSGPTQDYVGIFYRHIIEVEEVASKKFDAGMIERDGSVLITTADFNR